MTSQFNRVLVIVELVHANFIKLFMSYSVYVLAEKKTNINFATMLKTVLSSMPLAVKTFCFYCN